MSFRSPRRGLLLGRAFLAAGLTLGPLEARADEFALRRDLGVDVALTAGLGAYWLGTELAKPALAPLECRSCAAPGAFDARLRGLLRWENPERAHALSNLSAFVLSPFLGFAVLGAASDSAETGAENALFVLQAAVIAGALNQTTKFVAGRSRPFVAADRERALTRPNRSDHHLSFYSGHTSFAASVGAASAMLATLRGYDVAPHLWATFVGTTLLSGYLRIAADRHYASDVLVGALVGAAVGIAVPVLLHPRRSEEEGVPNATESPLFYVGGHF